MAARRRELRWRTINRIVYWMALAGITGAMLYLAPAWLPTAIVRAIHHAIAWLLVLYVGVHVTAQVVLGGWQQLLKIVTPRLAYGSAALAALVGSAVAVGAVVYPLDRATIQRLRIARVTEVPVIDGEPGDALWRDLTPIQIHTASGANLPGGKVTVRVRAVHDGDRAYFLFEWPDTTRSLKPLPLIKTAESWKLVHTKYDIQDEDDYYEDKLGVLFSRSPEVGGGAVQLGPKPLAGKPGSPSGRGLHYTTNGSYVDVWHWKSVRTGPLKQIDDNHFGPPLP